MDPEFEVLEPAAAEVLYEDCWQRWMDVQVAQPPEALAEALRAGVRVDGPPSSLRQAPLLLHISTAPWKPPPAPG